MLNRTFRRLGVVLVVLSISFLFFQFKSSSIISDIQSVVKFPFDAVHQIWLSTVSAIKDTYNAKQENAILKEELRKSQLLRQQYAEILAENKRLLQLLELKQSEPQFVTSARVISFGSDRFLYAVTIDKGSDDGVSKDMAIVTASGLAGKIYSTTKDTSKALLLRDNNFSVSARLQESRHEGIISGTGRTFCVFKYIPPDVKVEKGDVIVSSGRDGIFPKGIPIGVVESVKKEGVEFFQEILVRPFQSEARLEEVAVVKSAR